MLQTKVLGIDPGATTGAAIVSFPEVSLEAAWRLTLEEVFDLAFTLVGHADVVVVERYVITQQTVRNTRQPDAMYATGAVMMAAHRANVPLELQSASDAKTAFTDTTLRDLSLWDSSDHVRDATRHALLAARRGVNGVHCAV